MTETRRWWIRYYGRGRDPITVESSAEAVADVIIDRLVRGFVPMNISPRQNLPSGARTNRLVLVDPNSPETIYFDEEVS